VDISVRPHESFSRQGDDLHCALELPLHDAVLGSLTKIETFDGEAQVEINPGTQSGDQVTLRHKGINHLRGAGRGDLIVTFQVHTPTKLDSKQKELFRTLAGMRKSDEIKLVKHAQSHFSKRKHK
jgi:molecular chaperone DnaJ